MTIHEMGNLTVWWVTTHHPITFLLLTKFLLHSGRVFPGQDQEVDGLALFAGFDDGHITSYDGHHLTHEKSWQAHKVRKRERIILELKVQDFGVNAIAAGQVGETIYLYSGSLFGELVSSLKFITLTLSYVIEFDLNRLFFLML